jgi:hypothetical protein
VWQLTLNHIQTQRNYTYFFSLFLLLIASIDDENAKQRMKINARLGHRPAFTISSLASSPSSSPGGIATGSVGAVDYSGGGSGGEERVYVREHFVPPEISMINYFLEKVY